MLRITALSSCLSKVKPCGKPVDKSATFRELLHRLANLVFNGGNFDLQIVVAGQVFLNLVVSMQDR